MFPNWLRRRHEILPHSPKWPRHFSCSSFKDIQDLLQDNDPLSEPYSSQCQILHQPRSPKIQSYTSSNANLLITKPSLFSNVDHRGVVIYYTSLRVVRKTFEECKYVRSIFHSFRIQIDERDLSMDSIFQDELQTIFGRKKVVLPKVFIGGRYIGGVEEIMKLHESEELKKLICELPSSDESFGKICDFCSGWRFVMCNKCNGSHKFFLEGLGFTSCMDCNAQGLVRCVSCFPMHRRRNSYSFSGWKCKN